MDPIQVKPDEAQRRLWIIYILVLFGIGTVICGLIMLAGEPEALIGGAIAWVCLAVVMGLIIAYIRAYWKTLSYQIDEDSVDAEGGVFFTKHVTVPYSKVTNVDLTQGPFQRMVDVATIHVQTAGAGGAQGTQAELRLTGVKDFQDLKQIVTERARAEGRGTAPPPSEPAASEGSQKEILQSILQELKAMRELLEERQA